MSTFPLQLDLTPTYGAFFIGLLVSSVLFGVTNLQMFFYLTTYRRDWVGHRVAVYWLWFFDAFHLALISHVVYFYLVTNFANPLELLDIVWSFKLHVVIDVVVILSAQTLYTMRLLKLNSGEQKFLPWLMAIALLSAYGVGIVQAYEIFTISSFLQVSSIGWSTYMSLSCATLVDAIIAASLCYMLRKRRTGFSHTDSTVNVLMVYILNTGVLTSMCSITTIILYTVMPHNFIFLAVEFLLTKLYVNSYLAMLNARQYLQNRSTRNTNELEISGHEYGMSVTSLPKVQGPKSPTIPAERSLIGVYPPLPVRFAYGGPQATWDDIPRRVEVKVRQETFSTSI